MLKGLGHTKEKDQTVRRGMQPPQGLLLVHARYKEGGEGERARGGAGRGH
jgi:hypothetical protein